MKFVAGTRSVRRQRLLHGLIRMENLGDPWIHIVKKPYAQREAHQSVSTWFMPFDQALHGEGEESTVAPARFISTAAHNPSHRSYGTPLSPRRLNLAIPHQG